MTEACERFRATLRELADGAVLPIGDELALHLDACPHCRQRFDLGKIDLPRDGFEVLDEGARRRMVVALGSARAPGPAGRRWAAGVGVVAATVVIVAGLALLTGERLTTSRVADALVEDHIRCLGHPDRDGGGDPATLSIGRST